MPGRTPGWARRDPRGRRGTRAGRRRWPAGRASSAPRRAGARPARRAWRPPRRRRCCGRRRACPAPRRRAAPAPDRTAGGRRSRGASTSSSSSRSSVELDGLGNLVERDQLGQPALELGPRPGQLIGLAGQVLALAHRARPRRPPPCSPGVRPSPRTGRGRPAAASPRRSRRPPSRGGFARSTARTAIEPPTPTISSTGRIRDLRMLRRSPGRVSAGRDGRRRRLRRVRAWAIAGPASAAIAVEHLEVARLVFVQRLARGGADHPERPPRPAVARRSGRRQRPLGSVPPADPPRRR